MHFQRYNRVAIPQNNHTVLKSWSSSSGQSKTNVFVCFLFSLGKKTNEHKRAHVQAHRKYRGPSFSAFCLWGDSWIFSHKHGGYKRTAWQQQMKNKFPLFPTISSACHYHTDRSVTFLPDTLEANEKSFGWKMQHWTCDLFRIVIKKTKQYKYKYKLKKLFIYIFKNIFIC